MYKENCNQKNNIEILSFFIVITPITRTLVLGSIVNLFDKYYNIAITALHNPRLLNIIRRLKTTNL